MSKERLEIAQKLMKTAGEHREASRKANKSRYDSMSVWAETYHYGAAMALEKAVRDMA